MAFCTIQGRARQKGHNVKQNGRRLTRGVRQERMGDLKGVSCYGSDRLDARSKEFGRAVMETLFAAFDRSQTNPVRVPATEFRRLLWPAGNHPENWRQIVQNTLGSLQRLTLAYTTPSGRNGEDSFLSSWFYFGQETEPDNGWLRDALDHALGLEGHGKEDVYVVNIASLTSNPRVRAELLNAVQAPGLNRQAHGGRG